jgi:hypothetical protein
MNNDFPSQGLDDHWSLIDAENSSESSSYPEYPTLTNPIRSIVMILFHIETNRTELGNPTLSGNI